MLLFASLVSAQGVYPLPETLPGLSLRVTGTVYAIAPYGTGYVIGGQFDHVNDEPRQNIAYIAADGSLADAGFGWVDDGANGIVRALAVAGDHVYAAGDFSLVDGQPRTHLAKLSLLDGSVVAGFDPVPNGAVRALAVDTGAGGLFVGGEFTAIDGIARDHSAKLDEAGEVTPWLPDYKIATTVHAIAYDADQGWVYVGGNLRLKNAGLHRAVARLHAVTGAADPDWRLKVNPRGTPQVFAIAVGADHVYLGGQFSRLDNVNRANIARVDRVHGDLDRDWNPGANSAVRGFSIDGDGIVVGGDFTRIGGADRLRLARIAADGLSDPGFVVDADRPVLAMLAGDSGLLVGGAFRTINGSAEEGLARLDAAAVPDPGFVTEIGGPGQALAFAFDPDGGVIVGGVFDFAEQDGIVHPRSNLLRLDAGYSLDTGWIADVPSDVQAVAIDAAAQKLYIGGSFPARLARYDLSGAAPVLDGWDADADGAVHGLALDGTARLYVLGEFTSIGGAPRNGVARLVGANADGWNPDPDGRVEALALDAAAAYLGGECLTTSGNECASNLLRTNLGTGGIDGSFVADTDGAVRALALESGDLYLGGAFAQVQGTARAGLARIATASGLLDAEWAPSVPGRVHALAPDPARGWIYLGGSFASAGGDPHPNLARASLSDPGAIDPGWRPGTDAAVAQVAVTAVGDLLAGGAFTHVTGMPHQGLARLGNDGSDATAIAITAIAPEPALVGQAWTVDFTLSNLSHPGTHPIGSVLVGTDHGEACGPVTMDGSTASGSCQITSATVGVRQVVAVFTGVPAFLPSASAAVAHAVEVNVDVGQADTRIDATDGVALADGSDTGAVRVSLVDGTGAPVAGVAVALASSGSAVLASAGGVTAADGTFSTTLTDAVMETVSVTALYDIDGDGTAETPVVNGSPALVLFHGPVDPGMTSTRIDATDPQATADGIDTAVVTVTLVDGSGQPVPGVAVGFATDSGSVAVSSTGVSNASGQVDALLATTVAGSVAVTATYDADGDSVPESGVVNGSPAMVLFVAGPVDPGPDPDPAGTTRIEVVDGDAIADGSDTASVLVTLLDAYGNPVPGVAVAFAHDSGSAVLGSAGGVSNAAGQVGTTLSNAIVESVAVTATYDDDGDSIATAPVHNGSPALVAFSLHATSVTIVGHAPDPSVVGQPYTVSVQVDSVPGTATGTVLVSDGNGASCNAAVAGGAGACALASTAAGQVLLTASFAGSGGFADGVSAPVAHDVAQAATALTLAVQSSIITEGDTAVFTWTLPVVAPGAGTPSGVVTVLGPGGLGCSAAIAAGGCSVVIGEAGMYDFGASYAGDADFLGSSAGPVSVDVQAGGAVVTDIAVRHEIVASGILTDGSGDLVDYELEVSNIGTTEELGVAIDMLMPPEFADIAWTCTASGGASCGEAAGNGDIAFDADLPAGSSVLVELAVRIVDPDDNGVETVASAGPVLDEVDTANNTATTFYRSCSGSELIGDRPLPAHVCGFRDGFELRTIE